MLRCGRYSRRSTEETHISSSRSSLEPPAPSGEVRADSGGFLPKSDGDTKRETVGPDSHRDPEAWCSRTGALQAPTAEAWCSRRGTLQAQTAEAWCSRTGALQARTAEAWCSRTGILQARTAEAWCSRTGTLQARTAEAWCSRTGTLQAKIPGTASDGLEPSAFDPSHR